MFCCADPQLFRGKVRRCVFHCVLSLLPSWASSKPHSRVSQFKSALGAGFLPTLNGFQSAKTSNQFLNFAKGLSGFEMAAPSLPGNSCEPLSSFQFRICSNPSIAVLLVGLARSSGPILGSVKRRRMNCPAKGSPPDMSGSQRQRPSLRPEQPVRQPSCRLRHASGSLNDTELETPRMITLYDIRLLRGAD